MQAVRLPIDTLWYHLRVLLDCVSSSSLHRCVASSLRIGSAKCTLDDLGRRSIAIHAVSMSDVMLYSLLSHALSAVFAISIVVSHRRHRFSRTFTSIRLHWTRSLFQDVLHHQRPSPYHDYSPPIARNHQCPELGRFGFQINGQVCTTM